MQIKTHWLMIRSFVSADAHAYAALVTQPAISSQLGEGNLLTASEAHERFASVMRNEKVLGFSEYAVVLSSSHTLIGLCGLHDYHDDFRAGVEMTWAIDPCHQGNGYATEAAQAVLNYGLRVLKLPRIVALTRRDNAASIAVMKKIGMRHVRDFEHGGNAFVHYMI